MIRHMASSCLRTLSPRMQSAHNSYTSDSCRARSGWRAAAYAAVRWPRRWFTLRRFVWLVAIGFCGFVIWGAGSHLGPGLRAAHGEGIPGLWTAQEQNSGSWSGEFVSSSGTVTLPNVSYAGSLSPVQAGMVVPALDAGAWGVHVPSEHNWALDAHDEPTATPRFRRIDDLSQLVPLVAEIG